MKMNLLCILYLHKSHNTPLLPQKNLHRHCFRLLLGHVHVPGEIANNEYAKFWGGVKAVHYGIVQVVNTNEISFSYERRGTKTRFEKGAKDNSKMA